MPDRRARPRPSLSIAGKILCAFLLLGASTTAVGLYAVGSIEDTGRLVTRTYDKPLMAINFARQALFAFSSMERGLGRWQLARSADERARYAKLVDDSYRLFVEDIAIAEERSLSARSIAAIQDIRDLVADWNDRRKSAMAGGIDASEWLRLDGLSKQIVAAFETLIDLTAGDGFLIRQDALKSIDDLKETNIVAVAAVLAFALLVWVFLRRAILRPVTEAAGVAERIAGGDLETMVPAPPRDETGTLFRALAQMQTNLKWTMDREVSLRESAQARLIDAIEGMPEAMMLVDGDGRIIVANTQVQKILPKVGHLFRPGAVFREALNAADRSGAFYGARNYPQRPEWQWYTQQWLSEVKLADGRWLRVSRSRTRDGCQVVFWSDITAIMQREEELAQALHAAEAASHAKTNFLANVSHELRTPLNAINGFSEMLAQEVFGPVGHPQYKEYALDILTSGTHLLDIINDILDISKSESGQLEIRVGHVDIAQVVETCHRLLRDQARRSGVEIVTRCRDDLPPVRGDGGRIQQVLLNLLSNSIKFTRDGGRVEITAAPHGAMVELRVSDDGIGMDPADIPTALAPFGQIDSSITRRFEGTGLGLPLAKMLVELHGGTLEIESAPDVGTSVTFWLPQDEALPAPDSLSRAAGASAA